MPKILIADDDFILRELYKIRLMHAGFVVHEAIDGPQVVEMVEKVHPDVVLLDIMMPRMNGLDALKLIKSNPATKEIPVIILTALMQDFRNSHSAISLANDYILKSDVMPGQVIERIEILMNAKEKER